MAEHPFDEWFALVYPEPQPAGTRETALVAWNAAVHAACDRVSMAKERTLAERKYEQVVVFRDLLRDLACLTRHAC